MRRHRFGMLVLAALLAAMVLPALVAAELPPGSYGKLKAEAQEKLKIKIVGVEQEGTGGKLKVTFTAQVLAVEHSASGLKAGDQITIHSYRWTKSYAGPKNPPLLPKGWVGMAYLNQAQGAGKDYKLAAYGDSFEAGR